MLNIRSDNRQLVVGAMCLSHLKIILLLAAWAWHSSGAHKNGRVSGRGHVSGKVNGSVSGNEQK